MLATLAVEADLRDARMAYEPKYDGIRTLAQLTPGQPVRLWSRLGNDKAPQFPEICRALGATFGPRSAPKAELLLDGEVVALDRDGVPTSFEALQPRMHVARSSDIRRLEGQRPVALVVFDVLIDGLDLTSRPLSERRQHLEELFATVGIRGSAGALRLGLSVSGDGRALWKEAEARDWEGLVIKDLTSPYRPGRRTNEWRKLKRSHRREFVVGGYTLPRGARDGIGALLVGQYDGDDLVFAGGVGSGLDAASSAALWARLSKRARPTSPFGAVPRTAGPPHWVEPELVVEVKFSEITQGGMLRHPVFVGLRDDVRPRNVFRGRVGRDPASIPPAKDRAAQLVAGAAPHLPTSQGLLTGKRDSAPAAPSPTPDADEARHVPTNPEVEAVVERLHRIESQGGAGRVSLPNGAVLDVSNLGKVFWPGPGLTKGDLLRFYARISPLLLPVVADRPLVMQRFPDGVEGTAFYQHRAPEKLPRAVRVAALPNDDVPGRLIGGSLATVLYMAQLAVISQDPWFSRVQNPEVADQIALDLDPMTGVPFAQVRQVALWIGEVLEQVGVPVFLKTSGATGLHLFVPLADDTTFETGRLFAQLVGAWVARKHPKVATVERAVQARGATVYIDCLQNIRGKTLACAYSARASAFAGVSTPLSWHELRDGARPEDFTIQTIWDRLARVGDLWAGVRAPRRANLSKALAILQRLVAGRV